MKRLMRGMAIIGCLMLLGGLTLGSKKASGAETPADFYRGKTIRWIIVDDPGSGPDLIARIMVPFFAKDLGVKVKVENRKSEEGVNYLYNQGTHDGLTLGTKSRDAMIANEILKAPGVHYESDKFNFVADVSPAIKMFQIFPKLPYKTPESLSKAKGLRAGATSAKGSLAICAAVVSELLGLDAKIITGFKGRKELTLAVARGEVDFIVATDNSAMRDEKDGYVVNLFALGDKRSAAAPQAPSLSELGVKIPKELAAPLKFAGSSGTAVVLPPGVPSERVEYLRKIFQALGNNKEMLKELERLTGERKAFVSGQELQEEMVEIKADKELADKLDAIFKKYTAVR